MFGSRTVERGGMAVATRFYDMHSNTRPTTHLSHDGYIYPVHLPPPGINNGSAQVAVVNNG